MKLGQSTLFEIVPALAVESPAPDISWVQLVADADRLYSNDTARRAVYLAMAIKKGDPIVCLKDLNLRDLGGRFGSGASNIESGGMVLTTGPVHLQMQYSEDMDTQQVFGTPSISVLDVAVNGVVYSDLYFDHDYRITSIERIIKVIGGDEIHVRADNFNGLHHDYILRVSNHSSISEEIKLPASLAPGP